MKLPEQASMRKKGDVWGILFSERKFNALIGPSQEYSANSHAIGSIEPGKSPKHFESPCRN
jgi:hypothetical protein